MWPTFFVTKYFIGREMREIAFLWLIDAENQMASVQSLKYNPSPVSISRPNFPGKSR